MAPAHCYWGIAVVKKRVGWCSEWYKIVELAELIRKRATRPASHASAITAIENYACAIVGLAESLKATDSKMRMGS